MEDALAQSIPKPHPLQKLVLILVVMEDALAPLIDLKGNEKLTWS